MSTPDPPQLLVTPGENASRRIDLIVLVAVNVLMLVAVVVFGWDLATLLMTFWAETAVIGFWALANVARSLGLRASIFVVPFFTLHFGGFMLGHLLFLGMFLGSGILSGTSVEVFDGVNIFDIAGKMIGKVSLPILGLLFLAHGIGFFRQAGEDASKPGFGMGRTYGRVVVMHVSLILGAFIAVALGSPIWFLALLVVLKTAVDVGVFTIMPRKASRSDDESRPE